LGDFNINFLQNDKHGDFTNKTWESVVSKLGYQQLINVPTRATNMSSSTIDHIYSNRPEVIILTNVPQYAISDHLPVCLKGFRVPKFAKVNATYITYRSFRTFPRKNLN